jgi:hypothetical protein
MDWLAALVLDRRDSCDLFHGSLKLGCLFLLKVHSRGPISAKMPFLQGQSISLVTRLKLF